MSITCLKIEGLSDVVAVGHLEKSLEAVPGVASVEIDRTGEQAIVEHDGASPQKLQSAAADLGFRTTIAES
jgi:copper chaperone CopZ